MWLLKIQTELVCVLCYRNRLVELVQHGMCLESTAGCYVTWKRTEHKNSSFEEESDLQQAGVEVFNQGGDLTVVEDARVKDVEDLLVSAEVL